MSVNNEYPVLDGIAPSWADITVKATPKGAPLIPMIDIVAIKAGVTVEVGEQRGASGGRVLKRTLGASKHEASWTLYRSGYQKMLRGLVKVAPKRGNQRLLTGIHFGIQVQHTPPGDVEIYEYRVKGARVIGRQLDGAEGIEADQVEVPLSVAEIVDMIDGEEVVML